MAELPLTTSLPAIGLKDFKKENQDHRKAGQVSSILESLPGGEKPQPAPHNEIEEAPRLLPELPMSQVNWWDIVQQSLNIATQSEGSDINEFLQDMLDRVNAHELLTDVDASHDHSEGYKLIHRIYCTQRVATQSSLDEPWAMRNDLGVYHLQASETIQHLELYLKSQKSLSFVVYKDYMCCNSSTPSAVLRPSREKKKASDFFVEERVRILSNQFSRALQHIWLYIRPRTSSPDFEPHSELSHPFVWWYLLRDQLAETVPLLRPDDQQRIDIFKKYVDSSLAKEYEAVDAQLRDGLTCFKFLHYLYVPGNIQISKLDGHDGDTRRGFVATTWPKVVNKNDMPREALGYRNMQIHLKGKSWNFNGTYYRESKDYIVHCRAPPDRVFPIQNFAIYPLKFAPDGTVFNTLRNRGHVFRQLSRPRHVSYRDDDGLISLNIYSGRYVVDISTYSQLHELASQHLSTDSSDDIPENDDEDKFLVCLPATVPGYDTKSKIWKTLFISRISLEDWVGDLWSQYALPETRVKLLRTVVSHHTDLLNHNYHQRGINDVSGPHTGLRILLYGPPGTGKLTTAECIAHHARRPLFRLTVGDMGTRPESLAQYLDTELQLAKRWNCIVLMDEVDYFVADRPIDSFQRAALVSVFLQALDNYKGILICTCSLVNSLDPVVKSRFQLTLRYTSWSTDQRLRVWQKMAEKLDSMPPEVQKNFTTLAKVALNGHEIRNIISTASQVALQEKRTLEYGDIVMVMNEIA